MDKQKTTNNLAGLVTVKGEAKPVENISVRSDVKNENKGTQVTKELMDTPLNFKVSSDFRKRFKAFAVEHDLKQYELLIAAFEDYVKNHQKDDKK